MQPEGTKAITMLNMTGGRCHTIPNGHKSRHPSSTARPIRMRNSNYCHGTSLGMQRLTFGQRIQSVAVEVLARRPSGPTPARMQDVTLNMRARAGGELDGCHHASYVCSTHAGSSEAHRGGESRAFADEWLIQCRVEWRSEPTTVWLERGWRGHQIGQQAHLHTLSSPGCLARSMPFFRELAQQRCAVHRTALHHGVPARHLRSRSPVSGWKRGASVVLTTVAIKQKRSRIPTKVGTRENDGGGANMN